MKDSSFDLSLVAISISGSTRNMNGHSGSTAVYLEFKERASVWLLSRGGEESGARTASSCLRFSVSKRAASER